MSDYGTLVEPDTVRFERLLPGPIERIWAYLTEPGLRARWLAGGPMELRSGGKVELEFHHADLSPVAEPAPPRYEAYANGVTTRGQVIASEPPRFLSFTWAQGTNDASEVSFELTAKDELVQLVLTHRRLRSQGAKVSVGSGWHAHLAILEDALHGTAPQPFWPNLERLESEYAQRLATA